MGKHSLLFGGAAALTAICAILEIVGMCGIGQVALGAPWAVGESTDGSRAYTSFWGLYLVNATNGTADETYISWFDLASNDRQCVKPPTGEVGAFYTTVCRGYGLEHWHGFSLVVGFFATIGLMVTMLARRARDSKNRKVFSLSLCAMAWFFLVFAWGGYSAQNFPGTFGSWTFAPGAAFGCTVSAWVLLFIIVTPIAAFVKEEKPRPVEFPVGVPVPATNETRYSAA